MYTTNIRLISLTASPFSLLRGSDEHQEKECPLLHVIFAVTEAPGRKYMPIINRFKRGTPNKLILNNSIFQRNLIPNIYTFVSINRKAQKTFKICINHNKFHTFSEKIDVVHQNLRPTIWNLTNAQKHQNLAPLCKHIVRVNFLSVGLL